MNKVNNWINQQDHILIDSSMSTGLEERGLKLNSNLWTAAALESHEDLIVDVHKKYFDAGSSMTTTNTYQASVPGLVKAGYSENQAIALIKKAVELADRGRNESTNPNPKWLLGGVGPYGAFLANGSEYTGDYSLTDEEYIAFHEGRIKAMVEAGIDVLILETLPNINELKAITEYTKQFDIPVIVAASLRDKSHLADGSSLIEVASFLESQEHVIAYGLNCTKPQLVTPALKVLKQSHPTHKPFIAFPNSGATYNPEIKEWNHDDLSFEEFDELIAQWFNLDLKFVGGCCCMTEEQEQHIHDKFLK
ncbi:MULTISPECIES: homocysteine S-methyltransferase [Apilactobacillus]|uniref:homocysteine S-methyltransferase n=1 Tax=Apilactobacillus TaxID=2767877 RepID=UPI00220F18DA|nr:MULTISPECIES: homocysteine S-methyltransferase [Apilactobacillus]MCT6859372.1 homocysteine S-methyltransferase [Apilactobacillus sp.]MDN2612853.1 homocysteine S-methyltransferase [Apilactobacillus sp. EABW-1NA]WJV43121.1 homocysteine S-methyltransferase [Apilactobacillus kunkeei]CAI2635763.1 Homocysteine S-methyltransferase [Apilactobacillus kunkeei]CAI2637042.1 Homocysteine S-methyltransferase [Apilactobacillus kunkeei]